MSATLCDRGSKMGCLIAVVMRRRPPAALEAHDIDAACERGDADACEVKLARDGLFVGGGGSSELERQRDAARGTACRGGHREYCDDIFRYPWKHCEGRPRNPEACLDRIAAERRAEVRGNPAATARVETSLQKERELFRQLALECDAGDADACAAIPGRVLPPATLCRAGDYGACTLATRLGDAQSAEIGCAAGMADVCNDMGEALLYADQPSPAEARPWFQRACDLGDSSSCNLAREVEVAP